jgi:hypothetical protein
MANAVLAPHLRITGDDYGWQTDKQIEQSESQAIGAAAHGNLLQHVRIDDRSAGKEIPCSGNPEQTKHQPASIHKTGVRCAYFAFPRGTPVSGT